MTGKCGSIRDAIEVWWYTATTAFPSGILAAEEEVRFSRLRDPSVRTRRREFRAAVRSILTAYFPGITPDRLVIGVGEHGKPELLWPSGEHVHFNLSHTSEHLCVAVSNLGPLGVDVEPVGNETSESLSLWLPKTDATGLNFDSWTEAEAVRKMLGIGWSEDVTIEHDHVLRTARKIPVSHQGCVGTIAIRVDDDKFPASYAPVCIERTFSFHHERCSSQGPRSSCFSMVTG